MPVYDDGAPEPVHPAVREIGAAYEYLLGITNDPSIVFGLIQILWVNGGLDSPD